MVPNNFSHEFRIELQNHMIIRRISCPNTTLWNGSIECKHRLIFYTSMTFLAHSHLHLKFQDYTFETVIFLLSIIFILCLCSFFIPIRQYMVHLLMTVSWMFLNIDISHILDLIIIINWNFVLVHASFLAIHPIAMFISVSILPIAEYLFVILLYLMSNPVLMYLHT